jgi:hypothetical protein
MLSGGSRISLESETDGSLMLLLNKKSRNMCRRPYRPR